MKEFETPTIETAAFECTDVMTSSTKEPGGWIPPVVKP